MFLKRLRLSTSINNYVEHQCLKFVISKIILHCCMKSKRIGSCILDSFNEIIKLQQEMDYKMPELLNVGVKDDCISRIEDNYGLRFTEDLKALYMQHNGVHDSESLPMGLISLIPRYVFLSLEDAIKYKDGMDWEEDFYEFYEIEGFIGEDHFPFLDGSSGDCYWINLNEKSKNYGRIFWTNTLSIEPDYLFISLDSMLKCILQAYKGKIIYVDDDTGFLNIDYDAWHALCLNIDGSEYWSES